MASGTVAVLGTGMAGFGAGYVLEEAGAPFTCFDKNSYYGGHTHSLRYPTGFVFDEGGHITYTQDDHVRKLLAANVDGRFVERTLAIDNYFHGLRIPHPVQLNLRSLPTDLIIRIITDFVAAQSGPGTGSGEDYEQWLYRTYGATFAETFPITYGTKYHTTTMDRLTTDWIGPRMYRPSLSEILQGALAAPVTGVHYVDTYRYPASGGFQSYLDPLARRFPMQLDHEVVSIDPARRILRFTNGGAADYSALISSIPLPALVPLIDGVPDSVLAASRRLAFTSAALFNFGIDRADLSPTAITYFYDEDIVFSRVNLPHMFSENNAPDGCGTIQAEVYFSDKYKPFTCDRDQLRQEVAEGLRRTGFIRPGDTILLQDLFVNRYANVIYDSERADAVTAVHEFLDGAGIHYCGRYGNWDHSWTDQAFLSGESAARDVLRTL